MTSNKKPISIMLADSNPMVLTAMSEIFERDPRFSLVATTTTAEGFLSMVLRMPVQIGIIDWNLPILGGIKLIEILRKEDTAPRMIIYGNSAPASARIAMAAGAAAFVQLANDPKNLLTTCTEVAQGKMIFPFLDIRQLQKDPIQQLSLREQTLLDALAKGLTNRELASTLGISINTVKFHLSNLFEKLAVRNRAQAIAYYYSNLHPSENATS